MQKALPVLPGPLFYCQLTTNAKRQPKKKFSRHDTGHLSAYPVQYKPLTQKIFPDTVPDIYRHTPYTRAVIYITLDLYSSYPRIPG
jgi:hypothetical protein